MISAEFVPSLRINRPWEFDAQKETANTPLLQRVYAIGVRSRDSASAVLSALENRAISLESVSARFAKTSSLSAIGAAGLYFLHEIHSQSAHQSEATLALTAAISIALAVGSVTASSGQEKKSLPAWRNRYHSIWNRW